MFALTGCEPNALVPPGSMLSSSYYPSRPVAQQNAPEVANIKEQMNAIRAKPANEDTQEDLDKLNALEPTILGMSGGGEKGDLYGDLLMLRDNVAFNVQKNSIPDRIVKSSSRDDELLAKYKGAGPGKEFLKSRLGDEGLTVISLYDQLKGELSWSQDEGYWVLTTESREPGQDSVDIVKFVFDAPVNGKITIHAVYQNGQTLSSYQILALLFTLNNATKVSN